eukprot:scaffold6931_cov443-Prasinococcus_capsulatus_cf.AAC.1
MCRRKGRSGTVRNSDRAFCKIECLVTSTSGGKSATTLPARSLAVSVSASKSELYCSLPQT